MTVRDKVLVTSLRKLPDGELMREIARWLDDQKHPGTEYGACLRELAQEYAMPTADTILDENLEALEKAKAKGGWAAGSFGRQVLARARECLGSTTFRMEHTSADLTLDDLILRSVESTVCKSCESAFEPDAVEEDRCPSCGTEGSMASGIFVTVDGGQVWVSFP